MPRAGPLKQILRSLTVEELRSLRREHGPRVTEYDGDKDAFVERLHRSLKRSMDDGSFAYRDLMKFVRAELGDGAPQYATSAIRDALEGLVVSPGAGSVGAASVRGRWIGSELFQVLAGRFADRPYAVEQSASFGRYEVDLLVAHESESRNYVIEVVLAGSPTSRDGLVSQLRDYRQAVPHLERSYVLVVVERDVDLPANKEAVATVVADAEDEPDTEVVLKRPEQLLYEV